MMSSVFISGLFILILPNSIHLSEINSYMIMLNCQIRHNPITFKRYMRYQEIQCYLLYLAKTYPNLVFFGETGRTFENRILSYIKISTTPNKSKPMILIDSGIHAREWLSPAVGLFLIHMLVENPKLKWYILNYDWIFIPLLNPDGYEYSHTHDRMWRKNRRRGRRCTGVDLNRNFNISWMKIDSSSDECSEIYAGIKPFSELESSYLKDVATKYKNQIKMYISFHSYAPAILYPYSYTNRVVANFKEQEKLGNLFAKVVEHQNGTKYVVGPGAKMIGLISGVSEDWIKIVLHVPFTFTIELPPGGSGFDPPTEDIIPRVKETFLGIIAMCKYLKNILT